MPIHISDEDITELEILLNSIPSEEVVFRQLCPDEEFTKFMVSGMIMVLVVSGPILNASSRFRLDKKLFSVSWFQKIFLEYEDKPGALFQELIERTSHYHKIWGQYNETLFLNGELNIKQRYLVAVFGKWLLDTIDKIQLIETNDQYVA